MRLSPVALTAAAAILAGSGLIASAPASAAETDAATPVASVAIVMPLTVPITDPAVQYSDPKLVPTSTPSLIDAETLAYYTSPSGILTTDLDAVYDSAVTIGIDPLIIASIRALGSTAPDSARAWLDRLSTATNDTFALGWADFDLTAPLQGGRRHIPMIRSLDFAIDPARFSTAATASPDPSATGDPADEPSTDPGSGANTDPNTDPNSAVAPPLPTGAQLTEWNYTLPSVAWPHADTVRSSDFTTIAKAYSTTLLSSTNVTRTSATSATARIKSHPAIITDDPMSLLVTQALTATDTDDWDAAMAAVKASIVATAKRAPESRPASIVVALDRTTEISPIRLTATVAAIAALSNARLVGMAQFGADGLGDATSAPTATLISKPQGAARLATVKKLLAEESKDARFSTVADNPALITGERRIRLLDALSSSVDRSTGGWDAATAQYLADSATLLQSVKLERSSDILLLGDRESIRPAVTNDLGQPVTVWVMVRSLSPNLKVEQTRVKLRIEQNYQRKASVPVQAISNGEVRLGMSLSSTTGVAIGTTEYVPITVRAGWEGPFTLYGGIAVVLIFAIGIARTVVRRRKARAAAIATDPR